MNGGLLFTLALILLAVLAWRLLRDGREDKLDKNRIGDGLRHLNAQMEQYRHLSGETLAQLPDEALLEAVLSNLWAKMEPGLGDARAVMAEQAAPRRLLYAVYDVYGHVREKGLEPLPEGLDEAAECLNAIGAVRTAELLRRAAEAPSERPLLQEPFLESFDAEQTKARLNRYIREHLDAFSDPPEESA
ncbi:MAG TPA: hypothetical protein PKE04_15655 [Clostridia bacterium]|nr:hypothetical protein [Clostridia bacterium]